MALNNMLLFIYLTHFYVVLCGSLYPIHDPNLHHRLALQETFFDENVQCMCRK